MDITFESNHGKFVARLTDLHRGAATYEIRDDEDEQYAKVSIRFDGCSNWEFSDPHSNVMPHFCEPIQLFDFCDAMKACYMHAKSHFDCRDWWAIS